MKTLRILISTILLILTALPVLALDFEIITLPSAGHAVFDLSYDGSRAAVNSNGVMYIMDAAGNFTVVGQTPGGNGTTGIAGDGKIIISSVIGIDGRNRPAIWAEDTGWSLRELVLPAGYEPCDYFRGTGYALNGDGSKGVGLLWNGCAAEAFMWMDETEVVSAGPVRASTISMDGTVIGGFDQLTSRRPVYWTVAGNSISGPHLLHDYRDQGEVYDISSNGQVLVGTAFPYGTDPSITGYRAFRYEIGDTNMTMLGTLSGSLNDISKAYRIADNGVIVGTSGPSSLSQQSFIWTPQIGMTSLEQYLIDEGATGITSSMNLTWIKAFSNDGSTLIGEYVDLYGGWGYYKVTFGAASPVPDIQQATTRLTSVYPNPFNPMTQISFAVDSRQHAKVSVYDMAGRQIAVLADREFGVGQHSVSWQGRDEQGRAVSSGAYLVKLESAGSIDTRTISLLK